MNNPYFLFETHFVLNILYENKFDSNSFEKYFDRYVANPLIGNRSEFTVLGLLSIGIKILLPLKQKLLVLDKIDYSQGLQLLI
jgi:hypothetical protein